MRGDAASARFGANPALEENVSAAQDRIGVEVRITGRVQGVNFRAWVQGEAERQGVSGWIQNEPDGSVKALFAGPREHVEAMVGRCREGPPAARVADVETRPVDPAAEPSGFRVTG